MTVMKSLILTATVLASLVSFKVVRLVHEQQVEFGREVRSALAMPGTGLAPLTDAQLAELGKRIEAQMDREWCAGSGVHAVLDAARRMRESGQAKVVRAYPGSRTLYDVCQEMGSILLRRDRLMRDGRKADVAEFLAGVRTARDAGLPEEQVQALVRAGVRDGRLSLSAAEECASLDRQLDGLALALTAEGSTAPTLADVR